MFPFGYQGIVRRLQCSVQGCQFEYCNVVPGWIYQIVQANWGALEVIWT